MTNLPKFVCVVAPKCGTTSSYEYLRQHLGIFLALKEEGSRDADKWGVMFLYKRSGYYADHVEAYLSEFGRDNVQIYLSSDLQRNTQQVLVRIFDFLELSTDHPIKIETVFNKSGLPKSKILARTLNGSIAANVAKRILPRRIGAVIKNKLQSANTGEKLVLSDETVQTLRVAFNQDNLRLEELKGRETGWVLKNE